MENIKFVSVSIGRDDVVTAIGDNMSLCFDIIICCAQDIAESKGMRIRGLTGVYIDTLSLGMCMSL